MPIRLRVACVSRMPPGTRCLHVRRKAQTLRAEARTSRTILRCKRQHVRGKNTGTKKSKRCGSMLLLHRCISFVCGASIDEYLICADACGIRDSKYKYHSAAICRAALLLHSSQPKMPKRKLAYFPPDGDTKEAHHTASLRAPR